MAFTDRLQNRGSVSTGFDIENATAHDSTRNHWLEKTISYDSGRANNTYKKATFSFWIKRGRLSTNQFFLGGSNSARYWGVKFNTNDKLEIYCSALSGYTGDPITTRIFRDTASWYHIVLRLDTTLSTAGDRLRLYVNGIEEDTWDTAPNITQNQVSEFTAVDNLTHIWGGQNGYYNSTGANLDGYLADVNFLANQSAAPTEFGEFNDEGIWVPIDVSPAYAAAADSYRLEFQSSGSIGNDSSGSGLNFSGGTGTPKQSTDTPTNNFCTWNFNDTGMAEFGHSNSNPKAFSGGNLLRQGGGSAYNPCFGTFAININSTSSIWYWEFLSTTNISSSGSPAEGTIGWVGDDSLYTYALSNPTNNIKNTGTTRYLSDYFSSSGANVVMGVLLDCSTSNKKIKIYNNDSLAYTKENLGGGPLYFPMISPYGSSAEFVANFGGTQIQEFGGTNSNSDPNGYGNFRFSTKSGYALCSKNLAELG